MRCYWDRGSGLDAVLLGYWRFPDEDEESVVNYHACEWAGHTHTHTHTDPYTHTYGQLHSLGFTYLL